MSSESAKKESRSPHSLFFENETEKEKKESRATAEKRSAYNYNACHIASQAYLSPPTPVVLALPFLSSFLFFFILYKGLGDF